MRGFSWCQEGQTPPPLPKTSRSKTTDNLGLETPSGQILPRTPFLEKKFDPRIPNT